MSTIRGGSRISRSLTGSLLVALLSAAVGCAEVPETEASQPGRSQSSDVPTSEPVATTESMQPRVAEVEVDLQAGIDEATAFATSRGLTVGIAVVDRELGTEVADGAAADSPIFGASVVKLFLADNLLQRQRSGEFRLSPQDRDLLEAMLVASDDAATDSLYSRYGGEAMVAEVARRYQLPSVAPTDQAGFWELTTMSARDVARYYDRFLTRTPPADRDYLVDLLRRTAEIAADGFNQFFGLPAALPGQTLAIKQGWMCCPRDTSYLHSTGILGADNRYTVGILSNDPGVFATAYSSDVLTQIAQLVLPPGSIQG